MSDIWGLRCRMFRGAYGRSCMRLVLIYHIFERLLTSCPLCTSIFIPTMKYKSIFHHPILSYHFHSHPFQSSSKNIFITMSNSSSSSTLKSTIYQSSKSSPFPLGHSLRDLKLWHCVHASRLIWPAGWRCHNYCRIVLESRNRDGCLCFCRNHIDDCPTHG